MGVLGPVSWYQCGSSILPLQTEFSEELPPPAGDKAWGGNCSAGDAVILKHKDSYASDVMSYCCPRSVFLEQLRSTHTQNFPLEVDMLGTGIVGALTLSPKCMPF